jgi:peptide deformylase
VTDLPIRILGDPVLREPARDVESFDAALGMLRDDMLETMYKAPGVGLAAPQVGLAIRFFVYDPGDGSGPGAVANPLLVLHEDEQEEDEGCLSIPGLYFATKRALRVQLEGRDVDGNRVELEGSELLARIFQHETDHLNGVLFIDRLGARERREAMRAIREQELGGRNRWSRPRAGW